ncbi:MAG TPA: hypothetical protein VG013_14040, partial [Gemmataceae bacterium]|nr:hypothetical protein [Gemmataceae bacterium]
MSEADWNAYTDPLSMLKFLQGKVSDRKLRLFACACCRHFQDGLELDGRLSQAIEAADEFADGRLPRRRLEEARAAAEVARREDVRGNEVGLINVTVADPSAENAARSTVEVITTVYAKLCVPCETYESAQSWMAKDIVSYLREVFGNPFRRVSLDPAWLTPAVVALALGIYDEPSLPAGTLDT